MFDAKRLQELAVRLVASGPKAHAVSASECHEISEGLLELLVQVERLQRIADIADVQTGLLERTTFERDAYRAMVCDLLASAHPHPVEHPTMTKQWARARELLKTGPVREAKP